MNPNVLADVTPEPEARVKPDDMAQLSINVGFYERPVFVNTDDSTGEKSVQKGPSLLRFPVELSAKDALVLEQLLYSPIAFVAFEVQKADGQPGYYRLFTAAK